MRIKVSKKAGILAFVAIILTVATAMALQLNTPASPPNHNPGVGTGALYVYKDPERTSETTTNAAGNYMVLYGVNYYFRVAGVTEYSVGKTINIWATYGDTTLLIRTGTVGTGGTIEYEWAIPTLPIDTEIKFKYGTKLTGPNSSWYFAKKAALNFPRLLLVIPEVSLVTLGATIALFSGLGITAFYRKKRAKNSISDKRQLSFLSYT